MHSKLYANGRVESGVTKYIALAKVLDISLDYLLTGKGHTK